MPSQKHLRTVLILLPLCVTVFSGAFAQTPEHGSQELEARVQVLSDFHDVIYQIWHTAWPEKNVGLLVELLPRVKYYGDTLSKVKLSGILRDKQAAWDQGTSKLRKTVTEYESATSPLDSAKLLSAAERLHSEYEALVRTIRPVTKEIDQFHQVLYMIYHHYWPGKDLAKLVPSVAELKEKMSALAQSSLPSRLKSKEGAFDQAKLELSMAVEALTASDAASKPEKFGADLEALHTKYQALEHVFD